MTNTIFIILFNYAFTRFFLLSFIVLNVPQREYRIITFLVMDVCFYFFFVYFLCKVYSKDTKYFYSKFYGRKKNKNLPLICPCVGIGYE